MTSAVVIIGKSVAIYLLVDFLIILLIFLFLMYFSAYWQRKLINRNELIIPPQTLLKSKTFKMLASRAYFNFFNANKTYAWMSELSSLVNTKPCSEETFNLFLNQCTPDDLATYWSEYDAILNLYFEESSKIEEKFELIPHDFEMHLDRLNSLLEHHIMKEFQQETLALAIENFKFNEFLKTKIILS